MLRVQVNGIGGCKYAPLLVSKSIFAPGLQTHSAWPHESTGVKTLEKHSGLIVIWSDLNRTTSKGSQWPFGQCKCKCKCNSNPYTTPPWDKKKSRIKRRRRRHPSVPSQFECSGKNWTLVPKHRRRRGGCDAVEWEGEERIGQQSDLGGDTEDAGSLQV